MLKSLMTCAAGVLFATSAASAAITFSFASESHEEGSVFLGQNSGGQNQLSNFASPTGVTLLVDSDSTTPGGISSFNANFGLGATTTSYQMVSFGPVTTHQWTLSGSFSFIDANTSADILTVNFDQAVLTSVSSSNTSMGSTATLQSSFDFDPGLSFTAGSALNAIGITSTNQSQMQDFAFTFTNIQSLAGGLPGIDVNGDWTSSWSSDGSFSASAIPTPGTLAILILAGLVGTRRRRR